MKTATVLAALGCIAVSAGGCGGDSQTLGAGTGLELEDGILSVAYGDGPGKAVEGNDPRLTDARPPLPGSGGYIQNGTEPQDASFSLAGTGSTNGRLTTKASLLVDAATAIDDSTALLRVQNTAPLGGTEWLKQPLFIVDSAGGLLARGELGFGKIPMTGKGLRLMWHPFKAAFRAGSAEDQWDEANVGFYSWAGGNQTTASAFGSFAFGDQCSTSGTAAACFGSSNQASGTASFTSGASSIAGGFGSVAMGFTNVAGGQGSVAIGYRVAANEDYSMALGHRVTTATHTGSFIWGDQSTNTVSASTANNQFMVRAAGGVRLRTNSALTTGCDLPAGSGVFTCTSDRETKEDFRRIDGEEVLAKVARLPVESWRYREEGTGVRHLGPVAQDFRAAFGLGTDDKSIGLLDIDGVNMVAIQALERRTQELRAKSAEVDALRAELAELKRGLSRLEAAVERRNIQR
ncbi:tail fiber domain-containing protein [Pyxidicoccus xibeiensis]|uniref:tail fiber domain-containing protein n=1 Tax=Pyxidicoccus xibeiensis TaxID=2906759 RepID=UPI0020A74DC0|nr:tail fiber domain-containing protein [Pyxidicoccus xibeiensis]MCP3136799.1 tail fiber domain-containing protein [Pyxidicoccus xibeiensis]